MERLNFIEPPVSVDRYNPKGFFSRRRVHGNLTQHEWILVLADRTTSIRWTVPWWDIKDMIDALRSTYVRVAGLNTLTFYFPVRVMRQYGKRQQIPDTDTVKPLDKPMLSGNARSWEDYWQVRPRTEVISLSHVDAKISKHYLAWITASTAIGRAESRRAEWTSLGRRGRTTEVSDLSASKSRAVTVKDRLGPKKVPVWERLERLPPLTIDSNVAERRVAQKPVSYGKGKAVMVEEGSRKKKWTRKAKIGESSGTKEVKEHGKGKEKEKKD